MRSKYFIFVIILIFSAKTDLIYSQTGEKIQLKKSTVEQPTNTTDTVVANKPVNKINLNLQEKDRWVAVGLSLVGSGIGHFYIGKYSSGIVFFFGTYGFLGAGIASMMSAHQTKEIIVDGSTVREIDNTNKPFYMVGALFFVSSVLFYVGNVIDIFFETNEYNQRIQRLKRYSLNSNPSSYFITQNENGIYAGSRHQF